jgi:mycoredoxin
MIKMYSTTWCPDCRRAKSFLNDRNIAFEEINIEHVEGAAELVIEKNAGKRKVPTFEVDGRYFHCSPFNPQILRDELGLN